MKKINACCILLVLLGLQINVQAQQIKKVFDFGQEQHLPEATYVGTALPYNSDMRYGFDFGTAYRVAMQEQGFTSGIPVYFSVDLPEGNYKVTVTLSGKNTEMTVKAESKRLFIPQEQIGTKDEVTQSFTVSVFNPIIETGKKVKLKARELVKLDWDHKLTLEFLGTSTVQSIIIESVDTRTLFLAGDSTVTDQDLEPWASWGQFITAYLNEDIAVANQASSGASLASFRGSRIEKILSQLKADDFVIIEFGHNDEKIKGEGGGAYGLYTEIMTDFIQRIKEKGGIPILSTPTQRRAFDGKELAPTHGEFPDAMRKVAKKEAVTLIDLTKMTTKMYESWGPQLSRKAFVQYAANMFPGQSDELEDNTHFSNFGANEVALAVVSGLRASDSELKNYIAEDTPKYNPKRPNSPETYTIPFSSLFEALKPDGN
ncbi:MAG: rhamnogalacturonan acetylesterase [Leeuwenhoekiella sp.]|nr:rhamnogalacturonan acetylesterase [Leeuwenhoekiella sp.]